MHIDFAKRNTEITIDDLEHGDFVQFENLSNYIHFGIYIKDIMFKKSFILCLANGEIYNFDNVKHIYFKCPLFHMRVTVNSILNGKGNIVETKNN